LALGGDLIALRLCLDRTIAPRREEPLDFEIRELTSIASAVGAIADIVAATARGDVMLSEAIELAKLVELYIKSCQALSYTDLNLMKINDRIAEANTGASRPGFLSLDDPLWDRR